MNMKYKKSLKIATLLIASIIVATVSADVYYSLSMSSTITVSANSVYFLTGTDSTAAGLALGTPPTTATFTGLKAYPDAPTLYGQAVRVTNVATSGTTNVRLRPVSLVGDAADFGFVNFVLTDGSTVQASLNYTSNGVTWTQPSTSDWATINAETTWSIAIETKAANTATDGSVVIVITIDVQ